MNARICWCVPVFNPDNFRGQPLNIFGSQVFVVIAAVNCNETVMESLSSVMSKRWIKERFAIYIVNKCACVFLLLRLESKWYPGKMMK
jgi:hypothetical protein